MELIKTGLFLCAGIPAGWSIPGIVQEIIRYKSIKRNRCTLVFHRPKWHKPLLILLSAALFALAGWRMPLAEAILVCCFVFLAMIATIIDVRIRIIPNEIVLAMMILGVIYRIAAGGLHSLLSSLAALALAIVILGGAVFICKCLMNRAGIGAGDIKLIMAVAITVGYPGVFCFLGGMAIAIGAYCGVGLLLYLLTPSSTFPMCGPIMAGFLVALFLPYCIPYFSCFSL